ncbi:XRE family transcriptional regulator [Amycolatopsis mediterranei S699]|uniref:XRE family transcriptional regulator n=2 Tax=Amycolatopsis mediterranei TaxID=33910 RepID=A0A0H3D4V3_AMYMU|nr:helix-turn-helix domain-containing protein [Amycolatopsis mediterranei]ADJ45262.1 XRE family transcriptional regulator [Amycolatopsis mediterranei U32]AFO76973.1 XRE family transcriptional regulator [Amycolatopsis mediterranei S699]AGT84101.1 XRE family transcriptional regulator [Amycolatopsis mediterranei RB]KDO08547.1 XRE family transcriptional regulator [Amycolatopsis mediterranei]KDU89092.1 XRE family transcriptional regulator [Amycolatopsis mediterranei]
MALSDLGAAVRRLRENTDPAVAGLPGGRRRTRGLRREELAELAGVSADYVRRLEQGRRHPSAGVVTAIAGALRLGRADYERLCALAGYAAVEGQVPREAGPAALRLLERFGGTPAFLADAAWNVVAVNGAWFALQAGGPTGHDRDWNVAWRTFRNAPRGISRTDERSAGFRAMLAARLRDTSLRYPADTSLAELVDELRTTSRSFDTLWRVPEPVTAYENRAVFRHPDGADITLDGNLLDVPGDDLMAVVLTAAPASADAARLGELVGAAGPPSVVRVGQAGPG